MSSGKRDSLRIVITAYGAAFLVAVAAGYLVSPSHPIAVAFWADLAATIIVFGFSLQYSNASLYDPYWSVAPPLIVLFWMSLGMTGGIVLLRQFLVLLLVVLWASRLTWNWVDRWHGLQDEDFRYVDLRERSGRFYPLVNFTGIHLAPTLLVFAGCLPLFPAVADSIRAFNWLDVAATLVTAGAIVVEAVADLQLRAFRSSGNSDGVLRTGLWAGSRHPNYLGELGFWWGLFLFGLAADPAWWWTIVGPLGMTGLFVFISIPMMDRRMLERRPEYERRLRDVPALLPWPIFGFKGERQ